MIDGYSLHGCYFPVTEELFSFGTMVGAQTSLLQISFQGWQPGHRKCTKIIAVYHKRGKIHWAKHLQFQPYEVFHRNTFAVHWQPVFIIYLWLKIHGKTFVVLPKTVKTTKV